MPSGVYKHKPCSEEHKRKISEANKGKKKPPRKKELQKNLENQE